MQTRVERRRFTGTGRPVTSKMPSGIAINLSNVAWSSVKNPSSGRPSFKALLVENTHHDAFSPWLVGRHDTRKSINLDPTLVWMRPSLRDTVLRDDHVRLDFQARDDRGLQPFRRCLHLLHHAVNPVAQAETPFFPVGSRWMSEARQLERIHDDLVHQPDKRRVGVHRPAVIVRLADLDLAQRQLLDNILERAVGQRLLFRAVKFVQRRLDVLLRSHAQLDLRAKQVRQRINRVQVGRIAMATTTLVVRFEKGDDAVFLGDVARMREMDFIVNFLGAKIDDFRAELRGLGLRSRPPGGWTGSPPGNPPRPRRRIRCAPWRPGSALVKPRSTNRSNR